MQSATTNLTAVRDAKALLQKLPPLSPTLTLLLATLSRDDVSFAKIADLIEKDPVLAGNILGIVNSSLYGRRQNVSSVRHAVSLLGVTKLRNTALSMSITRMWNRTAAPASWSMKNFNQHGIAVAMLADILSQEAAIDYPEGAFVAGLLHDLGKLMIAVGMPQEYSAIERLIAATNRSALDCETEILGITHADLSSGAMLVWTMPAEIDAAVRDHHRPPTASSADVEHFPLSLAIAAADQYINQLGWGPVGYAQSGEPAACFSLDALGISDVQRLLDMFHDEFEDMRAFL